eukprot:889587-Pelagomonas_calceolata.AAC.1
MGSARWSLSLALESQGAVLHHAAAKFNEDDVNSSHDGGVLVLSGGEQGPGWCADFAERQASLGDIIFEKLREKQREKGLDYVLPTEGEEADMTPPGLDEKVIEVYKGVGRLLSRAGVASSNMLLYATARRVEKK